MKNTNRPFAGISTSSMARYFAPLPRGTSEITREHTLSCRSLIYAELRLRASEGTLLLTDRQLLSDAGALVSVAA